MFFFFLIIIANNVTNTINMMIGILLPARNNEIKNKIKDTIKAKNK